MAAPLKRASMKLKLLHVAFTPACQTKVGLRGGKILPLRNRGKPPELAKSFREKLAVSLENDDPQLEKYVNIGLDLQLPKKNRKEMRKQWQKNRQDKELEKSSRLHELTVPIDEVKAEWRQENGRLHAYKIARHYGIYSDLFDKGYFIPHVWMDVFYDYDGEYVSPVYLGNRLSPSEAASVPHVGFEADADTLWTLIMTNPDGHLTNNDAEYLHWFVGNIPGSDISRGETVCDYLQPFPPQGTGYHRHIFILYKQDKKIDYSAEKRPTDCICLKERTFSTLDFLRQHEDYLTPAGLSFFQADWDPSVKNVYHNVLNMLEPVFEYKHPELYVAPQKRYPYRQPFNIYLDRYRDKKNLNEEVLTKYLKDLSPFGERSDPFEYSLVHRSKKYLPTWLKWDMDRYHLRRGKYKNVPASSSVSTNKDT